MGNSVFKNVEQFKEDFALICGIIIILLGIFFFIMTFIPEKRNINCEGKDSDADCNFSGTKCNSDKKNCIVTKNRYYLIFPSLFFIFVGFLIIYFGYFVKKTSI